MTPFVAVTRVLSGFPLLYRARRQEIEPPYRACPRALVVRVGFRRALVVGWWRRTGLDEQGALAALGMRGRGAFRPQDVTHQEDDGVLAQQTAVVGDAG